ncbi:MAG: hypothetical protein ACTSUE_03740 [Promethearchaeota archaeon]
MSTHRAKLSKKLAQKVWEQEEEEEEEGNQESNNYAKRRLGQTKERQKKRRNPNGHSLRERLLYGEGREEVNLAQRTTIPETISIDEESIPFEVDVFQEGYEEGYSARDYGTGISDEEEEEKEHQRTQGEYDDPTEDHPDSSFLLRATLPRSEYHIYSTEMGAKFRLRPSEMNKLPLERNGRRFPSEDSTMEVHTIGLDRKQHTLRMIPPEHPGGRPLWNPITEDGYLHPEDREDSTVPPYSVEYVEEILERQDILRSHPDYEFLSQFASHLSLFPDDVFLKESVTRKQTAASALLEAVSARRQARALQLQDLGRRIERLRNEITLAQEDLRGEVGNIRDGDIKDASDLRANLESKLNELEAAQKFEVFLALVRTLLNNDDFSPTAVRNQSKPATGTSDPLYISVVEDYLKTSSPNNTQLLTKSILGYYQKFKEDTRVGSAAKNALVLFALMDFYVSFGGTFPQTLLGSEPTTRLRRRGRTPAVRPETIIPPGYLGRNWKPVDIRLVLTADIGDDSLIGKNGIEAKLNNQRHVSNVAILDTLFRGTGDEQIPRFIRVALIQDDLGTLSNDKLSTYSNAIGTLYDSLRAILTRLINPRGTGEESSDELNTLMKRTIENINQDIVEARNLSVRVARILGRDNIQRTLSTTGVREEFTDAIRNIQNGEDANDKMLEILTRWISSIETIRRDTEREIELNRKAVDQLQDRIDVITRTGTGPGEAEIAVPFRTTLEWALNPINTGRIEMAPWATSAINAGHAAFKRYAGRGRTHNWRKIERNVLQRDELMSPLFSEFCATFVNKAKIANPRRYMKASAEKELKLRKASILKEMLMDLRYVVSTKKFVLGL